MTYQTKTTSEFTANEWEAFEYNWVAERTDSLVLECELEQSEAEIQAPFDYERYLNQEGYTGRNESIMMARDKARSEFRVWDDTFFDALIPEEEPVNEPRTIPYTYNAPALDYYFIAGEIESRIRGAEAQINDICLAAQGQKQLTMSRPSDIKSLQTYINYLAQVKTAALDEYIPF